LQISLSLSLHHVLWQIFLSSGSLTRICFGVLSHLCPHTRLWLSWGLFLGILLSSTAACTALICSFDSAFLSRGLLRVLTMTSQRQQILPLRKKPRLLRPLRVRTSLQLALLSRSVCCRLFRSGKRRRASM